MGRGKLKMKFIENKKSRTMTYQKRKMGLMKKAEDFATLCDVPTCMIIYGQGLYNRSSEVVTWPKERKQFMEVINLYREKAAFSVRGVKPQNLSDFFADRQRKLDEKVAKLRKANLEAKFNSGSWDDQHLNNESIDELKALLAKIDSTLEVAKRRIVMLKGVQSGSSGSQSWVLGGCNNDGDYPSYLNPNLFQENLEQQEDIKLRQQPQLPISYVEPQLPTYYTTLDPKAPKTIPFDLNPINNPMMMMNNSGELTQFGSMACPQLQHPMYLDPMTATLDNVMLNTNPRALCYYGSSSTMQPLQSLQPYDYSVLPSVSSQTQMQNGSQFNLPTVSFQTQMLNGFQFNHEINQFGIKSHGGDL